MKVGLTSPSDLPFSYETNFLRNHSLLFFIRKSTGAICLFRTGFQHAGPFIKRKAKFQPYRQIAG